jgi:glutathionylspermidine synthase
MNVKYCNEEKKSWSVICYQLRLLLNMTQEQFNKDKKIRYLCECIEQWGYWEHQRRLSDQKYDKKEGSFWNGEEIH